MLDNKLSNYINTELKDIISSVQVFRGTSKDSGTPYYAIDLYFINGYQKRLFLPSAEQFAWIDAIEMMLSNTDSDTVDFNDTNI